MCGRYVAATDPDGLMRLFVVDHRHVGEVVPSYNVAPTDPVPAIVEHAGTRHLVAFRWGLMPRWATHPGAGARMINARAETVAHKPAFRQALAQTRCLLPADGFYEWERAGGEKLPWFIHREDGRPMAFAGLWSVWRNPADPGAGPLRTCTILTTAARGPIAGLHDRMPVALDASAWDCWLDRSVTDAHAVIDAMTSSSEPEWNLHRVSTQVNSVANNSRALLEPVGR